MNMVDRLFRSQMASRDNFGMILVDPGLLEDAAACINAADAVVVDLLKDVSMGDISVAEAAHELRRHLKMLPDHGDA